MGDRLLAQDRFTEAEPLLLSGATTLMHAGRADTDLRRYALDRVVAIYRTWLRPEQAALWHLERLDVDFPADLFAASRPHPSYRATSVARTNAAFGQ